MAQTIMKMIKKQDHTEAYALWGVFAIMLLLIVGKFLGWW